MAHYDSCDYDAFYRKKKLLPKEPASRELVRAVNFLPLALEVELERSRPVAHTVDSNAAHTRGDRTEGVPVASGAECDTRLAASKNPEYLLYHRD